MTFKIGRQFCVLAGKQHGWRGLDGDEGDVTKMTYVEELDYCPVHRSPVNAGHHLWSYPRTRVRTPVERVSQYLYIFRGNQRERRKTTAYR